MCQVQRKPVTELADRRGEWAEGDDLAAACMRQPGPGPPDSIHAAKFVSIHLGKQAALEEGGRDGNPQISRAGL